MIHETAFIHPKAHVEGASIGARSKIWQFATVIRGAQIGDDVNIASGACVDGSVIGDRSIICHNLAMGPGFKIGRGCFIGPNCTFCNDAWPVAEKGGFEPASFDGSRWAVIMDDGAAIGANSVILPGVRLGKNSMVAAGSVVTKHVPAYMLWKDGELRAIPRNPPRMRYAHNENPMEVIRQLGEDAA